MSVPCFYSCLPKLVSGSLAKNKKAPISRRPHTIKNNKTALCLSRLGPSSLVRQLFRKYRLKTPRFILVMQ